MQARTIAGVGPTPLAWDGKIQDLDPQGTPVGWHWASNGTYQARLEWADMSQRKSGVTAPITVLIRDRQIVQASSVVPNPVTGGSFAVHWWTRLASTGNVTLFNLAGERVAYSDEAVFRSQSLGAHDSIKGIHHEAQFGGSGAPLARGIYVAVIHAQETGGTRKGLFKTRFAVVR